METRVPIFRVVPGQQRRQRMHAGCSHRRCSGVMYLRHLLNPYFMPAATHRSANTDIGDKVVAFMEVIRLQVETGLQKVTTHCSIISAIYNRGKIQGMLSHKEGGSYCILLWGHQGRLPKKRTTGLSFLRLSIISQLRKG